jgi:hypothetical protein
MKVRQVHGKATDEAWVVVQVSLGVGRGWRRIFGRGVRRRRPLLVVTLIRLVAGALLETRTASVEGLSEHPQSYSALAGYILV